MQPHYIANACDDNGVEQGVLTSRVHTIKKFILLYRIQNIPVW